MRISDWSSDVCSSDLLKAQAQLLDATRETYKLAQMRFDTGIDDYLAVLDAQRSQYAAQQAYVNIKLARLQNLVTLSKALGGGWKEQIGRASCREKCVSTSRSRRSPYH